MKTKLFLLAIMISMFNLMAQAQIKGTIFNSKGQPVEAASIVLEDNNAAKVAMAISKNNGKFELVPAQKLNKSDYLLSITCVGYTQQLFQLKTITDRLDIGTIILQDQNVELSGVVVKANASISKTDRQLFIPQATAVKKSASGYDLLHKMMLPGLKIDVVKQTMSMAGGAGVAVYINDKKASQADVLSLIPEEVIRVEYIDMPGVQYANDNVGGVINFIVKKRTSGMVAGVNLNNAITTAYGNNLIFAKFNKGNSEFGLKYSLNYANVTKRYTDENITYLMPDGVSHFLNKKGINTPLQFNENRIQLNYNHSLANKHIFEVNVFGTFYDSPHRDNKQYVKETGKTDYYTWTLPTEKNHITSLDLFYKAYLPKQQTITTNLVGTYFNTNYGYSYKQFYTDQYDSPFASYGYNTKGEKYSLIGELRYNKVFSNTLSFMSGINHLQAYTKNIYTGNSNVTNEMQNANTYMYAQLQGKKEKLNYMIGVGISHQYFSEDKFSQAYWLFRPSLSLSYPIMKGTNLRYQFFVSPQMPTLSMLSNVRQQASELEVYQGNPQLKAYPNIVNTLTLNYQGKKIHFQTTAGYSYKNKPIMEQITRKENNGKPLFAFGNDNQKYLGKFWNYTAIQYQLIPDKLSLEASLLYAHYNSNADLYTHTYDCFTPSLQMDFSLSKWNIGASFSAPENYLDGETITKFSSNSNLYVNYQIKKTIRFGINWSYLMQKDGDKSGSVTKNKYLQKELTVYNPSLGNMLSITFSWNFAKGRSYQSTSKSLNNKDNDAGGIKY